MSILIKLSLVCAVAFIAIGCWLLGVAICAHNQSAAWGYGCAVLWAINFLMVRAEKSKSTPNKDSNV